MTEEKLSELISKTASAGLSTLKKHLYGLKIALTIDSWTSVANESYYGFTCSWIDENFELKSTSLYCGKIGSENNTATSILNNFLANSISFQMTLFLLFLILHQI